MKPHAIVILGNLTVMCLGTCMLALAASTEVKGMIAARTGETLVVKSGTGNVTVVLTDNTKTQDKRGLFGLYKEQLSNIVLIPGLKVDIDGTPDAQGHVVAKTITVDGDDLETAEMIQAGLHPTAEQVAANMRSIETNQQNIAANRQGVAGNQKNIQANKKDIQSNQQNITTNKQAIATSQQEIAANKQQIERNIKEIQETTDRFSQLTDYDVKADATVKFKVGSSTISPEDQEQLKQLAQNAKGITGYIIEVKGFADSSGNPLMNEKLSEDRAKRVVAYLIQEGKIPVRHIVAPGAMGEYEPVAPNETAEGRAENRRVEVKVLVNKGIAGK